MPPLAGMFDLTDDPRVDMALAEKVGGAIGSVVQSQRIKQEERYNSILQGEMASVLDRSDREGWDGARVLSELSRVPGMAKSEFGRRMQQEMLATRMRRAMTPAPNMTPPPGMEVKSGEYDEFGRFQPTFGKAEPPKTMETDQGIMEWDPLSGSYKSTGLRGRQNQSEFLVGLAQKVIDGTASDEEMDVYDRMAKAGGTTVNISTADTEKSADAQAETLSILQRQADEYNQANPTSRQRMVVKSSAQSGKTFLTLEDKEAPSAGEREAIAGNLASMDALDNIESLKKRGYVGPIQGRISQFKQAFGGAKEDQAQLVSALAAFRNQLIKEITGAQMSEPEARRIMQQIPKITDPDTVFDSNLKETRKNMERVRQRMLEVMGKTGLAAPAGDTEPPVDELAPFWDELTAEEKIEVNTILQADPSKLTEILRRLQ